MPSHGDFDTFWGASTSLAAGAADLATLYCEADIEVVEWGLVMTVAGVWTGTPCTAQLDKETAGGGSSAVVSPAASYALSPAAGTKLYVTPAAYTVGAPGQQFAVAKTQAGAATPGSAAAFIVYRRHSFQTERQTSDIDWSV